MGKPHFLLFYMKFMFTFLGIHVGGVIAAKEIVIDVDQRTFG